MKLKGFTLAEVMIVLTIIGILAGILIPVANNSRPDKNVMKFKKAHATLMNVVHELVTSDKYYGNGDLGIRPDGTTLIDGTHTGDYTYLCNTIADIISTKSVNCSSVEVTPNSDSYIDLWDSTEDKIKINKVTYLDGKCKITAPIVGAEIITSDGITIYQTVPRIPFGYKEIGVGTLRLLGDFKDSNGFVRTYKVLCIDIDGIPANATADNCVNECPFGYGVRHDGKIFTSARVDEWLKKGFQKGKKDN